MAEIISPSIIDNLIGPEMSRDLAIKMVEKLQGLYDQSDRYYHNFKHILQVISNRHCAQYARSTGKNKYK